MAFQFPAFLKLEHQRDGAARASFLAAVAEITGDAEREFKRAFSDIDALISRSAAGMRQNQFRLDLDVPGLQQTAREADFALERLRALRDASVNLAHATGDTSQETNRYNDALRAQVIDAERVLTHANAQVTAYQRLQAELDKTAAGNERLATSYKGTKAFASDLEQVERAIDPTRVAQQQLNMELERAERVFAAGAIDATKYGQAVNAAADRFGAYVQGAREGTSATRSVINSQGALRIATIQAGQQLQDIGISLYSGQRASVVFAQQLPQLAFALSGLEGSANKAHNRIGRFATFLSGPWGLAVGLGVGVLATLVGKLISTGEEADKASNKTYNFAGFLDVMTLSAQEAANAMGQLESATRGAIEVQGDFLEEQARTAQASVGTLEQRIAAAQTELRKLKSADEVIGPSEILRRYRRGTALQGQIDSDQEALASARAAAVNAQVAVSQRRVIETLNPGTAAVNRYKTALAQLNEEYARSAAIFASDPLASATRTGLMTDSQYRERLAGLMRQLREAEKAAQEVKRDGPRDGTRLSETAAFGSPLAGDYRRTGRFRERRSQGHFHAGVDYATPMGTPVYATQAGAVSFAAAAGAYGNLIKLAHGAGTETRYGHLSRFAVSRGQTVDKGDLIGYTGNTGRSTGPHLHYEVRVNGKAVDPGTGAFPIDPVKVAEAGEKAREAAQKAADALADFGSRSADKIADVSARFDEQPRLIDAAAKAVRELDGLIVELGQRQPPGFEQTIADAQNAKAIVADALVRPFRELREESERQIQIQGLLLSGYEREAEVLEEIWRLEDQIGDLTAEQAAEVRSIVEARHDEAEAMQRIAGMQSYYLDATRSVRSEVEAIIAGQGKLSNFKNIFRNLQAQVLTEQLFGDVFRDMDKWVRQNTGLGRATDEFTRSTEQAGTAALNLASAFDQAAAQIASGGAAGQGVAGGIQQAMAGSLETVFDAAFRSRAPANDNAGGIGPDGEIVVVAKPRGTVNDMRPSDYMDQISHRLGGALTDGLNSVFGTQFFSRFSGVISGGLAGYATGGTAGGIIGLIRGIDGLPRGIADALGKAGGGAATGSLVSGIGNSFGLRMSSGGSQLGGAIGSLLPIPGGDIIGSIAGGILGKLFGGTKRGSATIGGLDGALGITGTRGNSGAFRDAAGSSADSVIGAVQRIADAFGATVDASLGRVSIGLRDGKYRVDTTGQGITKTKKGAIDFGKDGEAAAIAYATADLIRDGVIQGLRAGTQRLLKTGNDLERQLQKALDFENVFNELRAIKDPVGAAIDALNKEFSRLTKIFDEAGASAQEYAQLEELYQFRRADAIRQAQEQLSGALRQLLDELNMGDNGLSLRTRERNARDAYNPLAARVRAGDTGAWDDFADAAQTLLGISRELHGSQDAYFSVFDEIRALSQSALDAQAAIVPPNLPHFDDGAGSRFAAAPDNAVVVSAIDAQTQAIIASLNAVNDNLGTMIRNGQNNVYQPQPAGNFWYSPAGNF